MVSGSSGLARGHGGHGGVVDPDFGVGVGGRVAKGHGGQGGLPVDPDFGVGGVAGGPGVVDPGLSGPTVGAGVVNGRNGMETLTFR